MMTPNFIRVSSPKGYISSLTWVHSSSNYQEASPDASKITDECWRTFSDHRRRAEELADRPASGFDCSWLALADRPLFAQSAMGSAVGVVGGVLAGYPTSGAG